MAEEQRMAAVLLTGLLDTPAEVRFDRITRMAHRHFGVALTQISLIDRDRQWYKSSWGLPGAHEIPRQISLCSDTIQSDSPMVVPDTHLDPDYSQHPMVTGAPRMRFYAGHPLKYAGQRVGTLCLVDIRVRHLDSGQMRDLEDMAAWAESEVDLERLVNSKRDLLCRVDQLTRSALLDHLTRAWNRAGVEAVFAREKAQAGREGLPISLIMIDIDHFKNVNDTLGHPAGDVVLRGVADGIRRSIRPYDSLGRMGGEEFLVIMPDTAAHEAAVVAERIRHNVASTPLEIPDAGVVSPTISLGLATMEPGSDQDYSLDCYTKLADQALYSAKQQGRNRVAR